MADSPENNADGPVGVAIKLDGSAMSDEIQLLSVRVSNTLNRIPEATFVVASDSLQTEDFTALDSDKFKIGTEVEIAAFYGSGDEQSLFTGVILNSRVRLDGRRGLRLELTCRDKAMALTEARVWTSYEDKRDSDIMSEIVTDAGLEAEVTATTETAMQHLRVGTTGWDYLRLLADRNGYVIYIDDAKVTVAAPDTEASEVLTLTYGDDIIELDVSMDAHRMIGEARANAWSEKEQQVVTGEYDKPRDPSAGNVTASAVADVLGSRTHQISTAREFSDADLSTYAQARVDRATLAILRGSIRFQGSGAIEPNKMLEIVGIGKRFSGNVYVGAVEHTIDAGSWVTTARIGLPQDWIADASGFGATAAEALSTPIHGLQIGKVVKSYHDPDAKQRILVSLPMLGETAPEVWARHATPYASADVGFQFLPEVGDEVIVAFLNADPHAPIIVGSLHNDKANRPVKALAENNIKTIVTREKLKITMDDEKKIITVETPGGHILTMDDDETTFSLEDSNRNSIVMDASGITMTTDADITMTAAGNISATATRDASVKGNNMTCEGTSDFTGRGGATAGLSSGGQTTVEGSMVMIN